MVKLKVITAILVWLYVSGASVAADKSLVFQYDFNRADSIANGMVKDFSPNSNDGLIQGDVHQVDDANGRVAFFDGTTGYIKIPSLSSWDMKRSVTISSVVKFIDDGKAMGLNEAHDMIIAKDGYFILGAWPGGSAGQRMFYFNTFDGKSWYPGNTTFQIVRPETWMQLDVRITLLDKKQSKYLGEFFVNGSKVAETPFISLFSAPNDNPVCVGYGFGGGPWMMHGSLASISLYNRALSDREIIQSAMANPYIKEKPQEKLDVTLQFSPKRGLGTVKVNGSYIGDMDHAKCTLLVEQVIPFSSRKLVTKGSILAFNNDQGSASFNIAKLPPGNYEVTVTCITPDNKTFTEVIPWEKPDVSIWRNAHAGVSDEVLPPWTPLVVRHENKKLTVSCWDREYSFNGNGLASNIVTRDEQVLTKPIEISAVVNGKPVQWKNLATSIRSSTPAKIKFKGGAKSDALQLSVDSYMEFDGLVVSKFTLTADKSAKVGQCALKIHIDPKNAKFLSYLYPGMGSYRGALDKAPKSMTFPYYMWIGDEDRGMCWFSERDLSKQLKDSKKAVEIQARADSIVIKINLLDKVIVLDKPMTFTVGFQATPMKPLPEKWRSFIQDNVALVWTSNTLNKHFGYPEALNPDTFMTEVKRVHDTKKLFVPYIGLQMLSGNTVEYKYFGDEWWNGTKDNTSADVVSFLPPAAIYGVCPAAHDWIDVETYHIKQFVESYSIDGLYHDFSWPIFCRNTKHGCPPEGGYPILAMRELYKRTYTILKSQPRRTFDASHTGWALVCAPVCSFTDATLGGEEIGLTRGNGNYYKSLWSADPAVPANFDGFLTDYMGRQFGPIPVFWRAPEGNPEYQKPKYEQRMLSIMLLHDVLTSWGYWQDGYGRMWKVLNDFGIDEAEFIPYWNKQQPVTVSSFDPRPAEYSLSAPVLVSVYNRTGNKALVVVANTSEVKIHASINIDSKSLGFTKPIRVRDAYNPEADLLKGSSVEVDIPELEYRLLLVDYSE